MAMAAGAATASHCQLPPSNTLKRKFLEEDTVSIHSKFNAINTSIGANVVNVIVNDLGTSRLRLRLS